MYGYKRARVDLDADTHETLRYFAMLQGINVGAIVRRSMALYAAAAEKEFPPVRVHMLAWREAQAAQRAVPRAASEAATAVDRLARTTVDINAIPF